MLMALGGAALAMTPGVTPSLEHQPAFAVDPPALLQLAKAQPPVVGMAVVELLEETLIHLDAQGRRETRYRYVFRVDHESGLDGWRTVGAMWKPWNQVRPILKARVVTPDGVAHLLDPATIGESPVHDDAKVFDDRKRLAAPLPQLCVGAVAEVEVQTRETAPVYDGGALITLTFRQPVPVLQTRVVIDAPVGMPLAHKVLGLPGTKANLRVEEGLQRLSLEVGRIDPLEDPEPHVPAGTYPVPSLWVSTVPSWASVARYYSEVVDRQLAGQPLTPRVQGLEGDRRSQINQILQRVHRDIRYTGLEFGAASIVPRTPGEVLTRGYGDCKDKATLLVGTLRAAGIEAYVALLNTGPGEDVLGDLPGLNRFDHAIAYVPGPEPLWIDATAEHFHAGELPFPDQGRQALIASPATAGLTLIPSARSEDYLTRETRDIFLSDDGPARVVERSTPHGLGEAYLRSELSNTEPKKLRENLKKYVQGAYSAKDLGTADMPEPGDLATPFTLSLEALDAKIGTTYDFEAVATINLWNMTERLRRYIPVPPDKEPATPLPARKHDLVFDEPQVVEWEYRIHPPGGFAARALPPKDVLTFGPASLSRAYEQGADGTVVGRFRFDSGKRLWSPAEVEAAKQAIGAFGRSAPTSIGFDLTAEADLNAGRIKESIQAYRAYAASRPGKAAPLSKLSMALLKGAMGELARAEARKACALEPGSMYAQRTLGYVLLHDLVGRQFMTGWDRQGAIEATREAKKLDPTDKLARKNLAIIYEYNKEGVRYGAGADLDLAIAEYEALRKDLKVDDVDVNLLLDFSKTGRFKELEDLAKSLSPSPTRSAWMITAAVLSRGVDSALGEANGLVPESGARRTALLTAGDLLIPLRRYAEAAALLSAGAVGSSEASTIRGRAAILAKARRVDGTSFDAQQPASVIWQLLTALLVDGREGKALAPFFTPTAWDVLSSESETTSIQSTLRGSMGELHRAGLSPKVALDLAVALGQVSMEGDDAKGYRIRLQLPGAKDLTFQVSRIKDRYLIAALEDRFALFGIEVDRRLAEGDLVGAKAWLDWVRDLAWAGDSEDPLTGAVICRFWTKGQSGTAAQIRLAAATLQVMEPGCTKVPGRLMDAKKDPALASRLEDLDLALGGAYLARKDGEHLEPLARRLLEAHPTSKVASGFLIFALDRLKRWDALLAHCDQLLQRRPDDLMALNTKAHVLSALGRDQEKERLYQGVVKRGLATAAEFNNLAWGNLMMGRCDDQTLDYARRSILLQPSGNAGSLHTLASILAERGELTEALEVMTKMLRESDRDAPRGEDWYVFARIAEQFGERDLALARYRKVTEPREGELEEDSCHLLARRRIQVLSR